jgi:hypothetical protein
MAYFIFGKDLEGVLGTISRIAENQNDLNNLNIRKEDYKIIEDSQDNFNQVKLGTKYPEKYNNNIITYVDFKRNFNDKNSVKFYIKNFTNQINDFLELNKQHPDFNKWNNYLNQLNSLNINDITYPLNKSLEQYFQDIGQPSLSPLQLP